MKKRIFFGRQLTLNERYEIGDFSFHSKKITEKKVNNSDVAVVENIFLKDELKSMYLFFLNITNAKDEGTRVRGA